MRRINTAVMALVPALFLIQSCSKPGIITSNDIAHLPTLSALSATSSLESGPTGSLQAITLAGNGSQGLTNGQGTSASFNNPTSIAIDKTGNQYVADRSNHVIRKISPLGAVTTLAGSGTAGVSTGTGTAAQFNNPSGVAVDASGNIYVADRLNHAIRKISPGGVVSNFAGIPNPAGPGSTDGPATSAKFNNPTGVALDTAGNVYVADAGNNKIRKITPAGFVSTLAGSGTRGGGNGPGSFAQFNAPWSVAVTASGIVFVADSGNHKIRKITGTSLSTSSVSTLAGGGSNGATAGFTDGTGTAALFNSPTGITIDTSGNLWVADKSNHALRQVTSAGVVTTFSGNGMAGFADGAVSQAKFSSPSGIAVDASANLFIADQGNQRIRELGSLVIVSTHAGNGTAGFADGVALSAQFRTPAGVAVDAVGNVYVADRWNVRIRKISTAGIVNTLAGNGFQGYQDGVGSSALFNYLNDIAVDASGNVYVADGGNNAIRKITPSGVVTTFAGNGTPGFLDGTGTSARFLSPAGVAVDASGNVYVADFGNHAIRKITPAGAVSTLAGNGILGYIDGTGTAAEFNGPSNLTVDISGNVYVSDAFNHRVRKISPTGTVTTLAGSGASGYADGPGSLAMFVFPEGITVDGSGNLFVADPYNARIRKISPSGVVSTLAGNGTQGFSDGIGPAATLNYPVDVELGSSNILFVADLYNNRIRKIQ